MALEVDAALVDRLGEVEDGFREAEAQLIDPDVLADSARYADVAKRHSDLKTVVGPYRAYLAAAAEGNEALELAASETDPEMVDYLQGIAKAKRAEMEQLEDELRRLLVPKDPNDEKDVLIEIRAAAGGDESAIWAGDLFRMYDRFAERHGFKREDIDSSPSESGGFSKVVFAVKGRGAYSQLKYEAGVHRVQRIPKTESQGRVHTSTATVAVLPEVEDVEVDINDHDLEIDVFRSSGPGGQSVNTTDSAVRITHKPTGIVVSCQDEKSQLQNKLKAMRVLRARLYQIEMEKQHAEIAGNRRAQVGTGDRSEKIRTYNYKENRVTDHRIGLTIKQLPAVLEGDLDGFISALQADEEARRLAEGDG